GTGESGCGGGGRREEIIAPPPDRLRADRQSLEHVRGAPDATIDEHVDSIGDGVDDLRQLVKTAPRSIELAAAMIGDHDTCAADIDRLSGIIDTHDAFKAELAVPQLDHFSHVGPTHRG